MRHVAVGFVVAFLIGFSDVAFAQEDYTALKHFISASDHSPVTALTEATDGNLYGALNGGGIYRWTRDGAYARISEAASLYDLVLGSDGFLYGNTQSTIHRIAITGEYTELAVFSNGTIDGRMMGSLVEGDDGNFYGIAKIDSFEAAARIFRVTPAGVISTVHLFAASDHPLYADYTRMIKGQDGYFYGTTEAGGAGYHGTIFRFHPDGSYDTLHTFTGLEGGSQPQAPLVETDAGTFYGTTSRGGIGNGTIFRFRPGLEFTIIHAFQEPGSWPRTTLTAGGDGLLYGTTTNDGIFRVSPAGNFQVLHRTIGSAAETRWGSGFHRLVQWYDGNFYGTGRFGGASEGVLFRLNRERTACANELNLTFPGFDTSTLTINHVVKTEWAALGGLYLVSQYGVHPIWSGILPPVTPTIVYELPLEPFPSIGTVGVFSFVITSGLQTCSDWTTIETGGAIVSPAELQRKLTAALSATPVRPQ